MQAVIIIVHLMIVLSIIALVLLQRSEGGGLGIGSSGGFMTNRGTGNILSKSTAILAAAFFATSLLLSWLAGFERKPASILQPGSAPTTQAPAPGSTPLGQGGRGVLDTLRGGEAAPSGPQVPSSQ